MKYFVAWDDEGEFHRRVNPWLAPSGITHPQDACGLYMRTWDRDEDQDGLCGVGCRVYVMEIGVGHDRLTHVKFHTFNVERSLELRYQFQSVGVAMADLDNTIGE